MKTQSTFFTFVLLAQWVVAGPLEPLLVKDPSNAQQSCLDWCGDRDYLSYCKGLNPLPVDIDVCVKNLVDCCYTVSTPIRRLLYNHGSYLY